MNDIINTPKNPLLLRAQIPGETFQLPSKGILYKNGELDDSVINGELMVNPMITMDEIILKTPDRLLNGTGIVEVFRRCVPQVKKPLDLFAKDMDYLLVCLRKITYGPEFEYAYLHDCENAKEHNYMISLDDLIFRTKALNPSSVESEYRFSLPNGQSVLLHPPVYHEILHFLQIYDKRNDEDFNEKKLTDQLIASTVAIISSVDNVDNKEFIDEWARSIPSGYIKKIGNAINNVSQWGPDLDISFNCKDCGTEIKSSVSLNPINFFS